MSGNWENGQRGRDEIAAELDEARRHRRPEKEESPPFAPDGLAGRATRQPIAEPTNGRHHASDAGIWALFLLGGLASCIGIGGIGFVLGHHTRPAPAHVTPAGPCLELNSSALKPGTYCWTKGS